MSNFNLLSDRIRYVLQHYCKNQAELAGAGEVTAASVTAWLNGATKKIRGEVALKIARKYGLSPDWILDGSGLPESQPIAVYDGQTKDDRIVEIPEYRSVNFGCGPGRMPDYDEEHDVISRPYLLSLFNDLGINPKNCIAVIAEGDSMNSRIQDGDVVLINTNDKDSIKSGHIYAFMLDEQLHIKRLFVNLRGDITVKSDNPDYAPETFARNNTEHNIQIMGRVVEISGTRGL